MSLLRTTLLTSSILLGVTTAVFAEWFSVEPQTRMHTISAGDTITKIANYYGFSPQELASYNKVNLHASLPEGGAIYFPEDADTTTVDGGTESYQDIDGDDVLHLPGGAGTQRISQNDYVQQINDITSEYGANTAAQSSHDVDTTAVDTGTQRISQNDYVQQIDDIASEYGANTAAHSSHDADTTAVDTGTVSRLHASDLLVPPDVPFYDDMKEIPVADSSAVELAELEANYQEPALQAFGDQAYTYVGKGEELKSVLDSFASSYYVPLTIDPTVIGEINGQVGPLKPIDFLDRLAKIYGFIWYFDGHTLFVYNSNATQQQILSLDYLAINDLKATLMKIGIYDSRFFWKGQPEEGLVFISGPPRYIQMVAETAALLDGKEGERQKSKLTVRTFPLKYAWATDKSFSFRGQAVTVPGVATILTSIIKGGGVSQVSKAQQPLQSVEAAPSVSQLSEPAQAAAESLNAGANADNIYINADPRLNAIIVHDLETKMEMYAELIASLDRPTSQIEISVSIIDINTSDLQALGVQWDNLGDSDIQVEFKPTTKPAYSTIVSANMGDFSAKLQMLADEGKSRIVSRPSILTLDNIEAVLDNSSTFYVAVEGQEDSQLFPVTSGTVVQVTPRIVREELSRRIHMSVNIQDGSGSQGGEDVGSLLPQINNSSINTQAIIGEQESLLIGGFYKELEEDTSSKVPLLGDLPWVGQLFRADASSKIKQVRLFLITPKIIDMAQS